MADRWEAQYGFWASFGIPAYEESSVPDRDELQRLGITNYITYQPMSAGFDRDTSGGASIWTRSDSWYQADTLADTIEARLKNGGEVVPYTGGMMWITAEAPFAQNLGDPDDDKIKRKVLNVVWHFA